MSTKRRKKLRKSRKIRILSKSKKMLHLELKGSSAHVSPALTDSQNPCQGTIEAAMIMPDDMYSFKYRNGGFVSCVSSDLVIILFFPVI